MYLPILLIKLFKEPFSQYSNTKYKLYLSYTPNINININTWKVDSILMMLCYFYNRFSISLSLYTCLVLLYFTIWLLSNVLIATFF
jgi:hypothetical protein